MSDLISRQAAIDAVAEGLKRTFIEYKDVAEKLLNEVPSVQPEPAIPLQWIEAQIEWLKSLDNAFSVLTAGQISAMVNKWEENGKNAWRK